MEVLANQSILLTHTTVAVASSSHVSQHVMVSAKDVDMSSLGT